MVSSFSTVTVQHFFCEPLRKAPDRQRCEAFCQPEGERFANLVVSWIEPIAKAWKGSLMSQAQIQGFPVVITYHEDGLKFLQLDSVRRAERKAS